MVKRYEDLPNKEWLDRYMPTILEVIIGPDRSPKHLIIPDAQTLALLKMSENLLEQSARDFEERWNEG